MATGEALLFKQIWDDLEPEDRVSFVTGGNLEDIHEMRSFYFAHVLGKGAYPEFRLYRPNIVLLTLKQHTIWDTARWKIRDDPTMVKFWQKMYDLEEELKQEYWDIRNLKL